MVMSSS